MACAGPAPNAMACTPCTGRQNPSSRAMNRMFLTMDLLWNFGVLQARACILVFTTSTGYMMQCSATPADALVNVKIQTSSNQKSYIFAKFNFDS